MAPTFHCISARLGHLGGGAAAFDVMCDFIGTRDAGSTRGVTALPFSLACMVQKLIN